MPPLYTYPSNRKGKTLYGDNLHNHDKELMGRNNAARREEELTKQRLEARQPWRDKLYTEGHITRTLRYVGCMRLPRWHWKRRRIRRAYRLKRHVPKTTLNTIKKFNLL